MRLEQCNFISSSSAKRSCAVLVDRTADDWACVLCSALPGASATANYKNVSGSIRLIF